MEAGFGFFSPPLRFSLATKKRSAVQGSFSFPPSPVFRMAPPGALSTSCYVRQILSTSGLLEIVGSKYVGGEGAIGTGFDDTNRL